MKGVAATDPLAPLSSAELLEAVRVVREFRSKDVLRFASLELEEPSRKEYVEWREESKRTGSISSLERKGRFAVIDQNNETYEGVVSLSNRSVISYLRIPMGQPPFQIDEFLAIEECVQNDPDVRERLRRRGITDFKSVMVDAGSVGTFGFGWEKDENGNQRRLSQALLFLRVGDKDDNGYAHPIDGLIPIVDVNQLRVIHIEEHDLDPPPMAEGNYSRKFVKSRREEERLKPLAIVQPEGPSFKVVGNDVFWDRWSFKVGFNSKEGLVLYTIEYANRPIVYRASLVEMTVPYGDPRPQHFRKNAFDVGEYGVGRCSNSLKLGCDCLGHIHYFDAEMIDSKGTPILLKNAICMHEEDFGILWKHLDWRTGDVEVRRSRRLVVSFFTTVANYEYGFYYHLYQDGKIEFEVKLTGIINTGHCPKGKDGQYIVPKYGAVVGKDGLYGLIHQHFFCFRLDMAVDGYFDGNSISELNAKSLPEDDKENAQKNGFFVEETPLFTEKQAKRNTNSSSSRCWRVFNPSKLNPITQQPVSYMLEPGSNTVPLAGNNSILMKRADYLRHHLHVTQHHPEDRFPSGEYPNQHPGLVELNSSGLPFFTSTDRSLQNADLVLWYTLGKTHQPRPEDWPVMPVVHASFELRPNGFFERNPALDLPPEVADRRADVCCHPKL